MAADPSFPAKSVTEVLLAAGTQLSAEWNRRGAHRLLPEIDFVFPAMVAAVVGKYYRYVRVRVEIQMMHTIVTRVNVKFLGVAASLLQFKADFSGIGILGFEFW